MVSREVHSEGLPPRISIKNDRDIELDWCRVSRSQDYDLVEDQYVPSWIEWIIHGNAGQTTSTMRVEVRDGAVEVTKVQIESRPGEPPVRQMDLRNVDVKAGLRLAAVYAVEIVDGGGSRRIDAHNLDAVVEKLAARAPSRRRDLNPDFLKRVAGVYRANIDNRPVEAVMSTFVVAQRTAAQYLQLARKAGFLPKTTRGKKRA